MNPFYFFVNEILFVALLGGECLTEAFCWFLQFFPKEAQDWSDFLCRYVFMNFPCI